MMVHGLGLTGRWHGYFQDSHERILEDNFMTVGRRCDGVITLREIRFISRRPQNLPTADCD